MPTKMAGKKDSSLSSPPPATDACSNATRLQRNLAEKQRRDKLNGFITELATIVPMVSMASKRLDKTSILRLSAAHLRISQSFLGGNRKKSKRSFKWRPNFFNNEQMREILECVEGFLLVTTGSGKIMYVSSSVERFLGHQNLEMIGHSIISFVHPSDSDMVREQLKTLSSAIEKSSSKSARCSFYCRLREKSQPRSEVLTYQFVHIVGHMTSSNDENDSEMEDEDENSSSKASSSSTSLNLILKAFARVVHSNPYNELSLTDMIEDEYVTRHAPDGMIVFSDHRLSTITGHLPHEVYGMSAYEYIFQEDIPVALFAHRLMFTSEGGTGMIVYRLRMRNEGFVYLKSTGYLQYAKSAGQVDHFVCVNKQLSDEEGEKELKKFIDRFTPHIQDTCPSALYESIKNMQCLPAAHVKVEKPDTENVTNCMDTSNGPSCSSEVNGVKPSGRAKHKALNAELDSGSSSVCSKQLYDKISLETEASGQILSSYSPLTESSLSANSPQSEDTCTPSPVSSGVDHMEVTYSLHDTSSSSEVPNDLAVVQNGDFNVVVGSNLHDFRLNPASPVPVTMNSYSTETDAGVFADGGSARSPVTAAPGNDISRVSDKCWKTSPRNHRYVNGVIPTPPPSSAEENSESQNAGC